MLTLSFMICRHINFQKDTGTEYNSWLTSAAVLTANFEKVKRVLRSKYPEEINWQFSERITQQTLVIMKVVFTSPQGNRYPFGELLPIETIDFLTRT